MAGEKPEADRAEGHAAWAQRTIGVKRMLTALIQS